MVYGICGAAAGTLAGIIIMFFISVIQTKYIARRYRARMKAAGEAEDKRKIEFSKILAIWAAIMGTGMLIASVTLAAFDKQSLSDITIAVFTACIGYLITYAGKSAFEKSSRNKHGLDEDGIPFDDHYDHTGG